MLEGNVGDPGKDVRSQLQIWTDEVEAEIGCLQEAGEAWRLHVVVEPVRSDLFHGRISFRSGEERFDTAPILVEETREAVIERAGDLPGSTLSQLLLSVRS